MALGNVTVNALNLAQGAFPTVEKYFLFIGVGPINRNTVQFLNGDSDLDAVLGTAASELKTQISAARNNGGQNWACAAIAVADGTAWSAAVDLAMNANLGVEAVVVCTPVTTGASLTAMQTKAGAINTAFGRRLFFIATTLAIDPTPSTGQTWATYVTALTALTTGINALRVSVVAQIFASSIGIYAGRLCNAAVSVADTPMRVETGPLVGVDVTGLPLDNTGVRYSNAQAKALNDQRFAVPQLYSDYPGVFWSDGQMLDAPAGDYQVVENLRIVDKAARAVRLVLIGLVGNRRFNSSPVGTDWATLQLMRPLREMSKSVKFQGIPFPAEIQAPIDGDILINWVTRTQVQVFIKARPYQVPKDLTANIMLDLTTL